MCLAADVAEVTHSWSSVKFFLKRATQLAGVEPDLAVYMQAAMHWQ